MDYILTIKIKRTGFEHHERWDVTAFNTWIREQGQRIAGDVDGRTKQLRNYTNRNVVDWYMTDDKAGTGENVL